MSKSKKDLFALNARKQKVVTAGKNFPTRREGHEGDIVIRKLPIKGLHLFVKHGQRWYSIPLENNPDSKHDRDRVIVKPRKPKESPFQYEIFKKGNDVHIKIDDENSHILGKAVSKITRDVEEGNPTWQIGSSDDECMQIVANYDAGSKGVDFLKFETKTESVSANKGSIKFSVDESQKLVIDDGGLSVTGTMFATSDISTYATGKIYFDNGSHTYIHQVSTDKLDIVVGGETILELTEAGGGANDSAAIQALNKLYFDGGGDTYIQESAADTLDFVVGAQTVIQIDENGVSGNVVKTNGSIGFKHGNDLIMQPTYGDVVYTADSGNNTDIDFRECNKARIELTGGQTVGIMGFIFPEVSGNFVLALEQDGSGTGVITAYNAIKNNGLAAGGSSTLLFAGGSNPTLTTTANKTDILSIFWDAETFFAYATIVHNF